MSDLNRRDTVKLVAGMAVVGLGASPTRAREPRVKEEPFLDGVLRVAVTPKGVIELRFETPGTAEQTFDSSEYRYAVLDSEGKQVTSPRLEVSGALRPTGAAYHPVSLPKGRRTVEDYSEVELDRRPLKAGDYYLVVSVRNLTALAKFKSA